MYIKAGVYLGVTLGKLSSGSTQHDGINLCHQHTFNNVLPLTRKICSILLLAQPSLCSSPVYQQQPNPCLGWRRHPTFETSFFHGIPLFISFIFHSTLLTRTGGWDTQAFITSGLWCTSLRLVNFSILEPHFCVLENTRRRWFGFVETKTSSRTAHDTQVKGVMQASAVRSTNLAHDTTIKTPSTLSVCIYPRIILVNQWTQRPSRNDSHLSSLRQLGCKF
jgi:hypothetical protein